MKVSWCTDSSDSSLSIAVSVVQDFSGVCCILTAATKLFSVMKVTHSRGSVSELRLFTLWSHNKGQECAHTPTQTHRYVAAPPSLTGCSCLPLRRTRWSHATSRPGGCQSARNTHCGPTHHLHPKPEFLQTLRPQTTSPRMASCCPRVWGQVSLPPP